MERLGMKAAKKAPLNEAPLPPPVLPPDWKLSRQGDAVILQARTLAQFPWLAHGFSTRVGGASLQNGSRTMNLGFVEWDEPSRVERNRREFFTALGARNMEPVMLRQFHSSFVQIVPCGRQKASVREKKALSPGAPRPRAGRGDALATRERGLLLTVQTADCVPILLADPRRHVVAAIHAGWRGTVARIAEKAVGRLRIHFGTRPQDLWVAIGPAIGVCCYEVGVDVAREFDSQFACASKWFEGPFEGLAAEDEPTPFLWLQTAPPGHARPRQARLDLAAANRWQLENAGVAPERISACGLCTSCRNDWFFSYRREGARTGRMMAAIGIKKMASD
jgi:polyphenol oxidase